jgi:hypothetical protein
MSFKTFLDQMGSLSLRVFPDLSAGMNVIDRVSLSALDGSERLKKFAEKMTFFAQILRATDRSHFSHFWREGFGCRVTHSLHHIISFILSLDLQNGSVDLSELQSRRALSKRTHHSKMV